LPPRVRTSIAFVLRDEPRDDHLAVPHVVFFDGRPLANPTKLHERVPCVVLERRLNDVRVIPGIHDAELDQLGIRDKVQRDEIRA